MTFLLEGEVTAPPPAPRRNFRFAIRLRTMLLIVLVVALGLGYLDYRRRRAAVDHLLAQLSIRVFVSIGTTHPLHNPVHDPGGTYADATRRVRQLHVEHWAVADLIPALRQARLSKDEKGIRNALAALQDLGPAITAAKSEVLRVVRGEGLASNNPNEFALVRGLAIHVLGKIAKENESAIGDLIGTLDLPDASRQRRLTACSVNEIGGFGPKAVSATTALVRLIDPPSPIPFDGAPMSIVSTLGAIGPGAHGAVPILQDIARDRNQDPLLRSLAIRSISLISFSRIGNWWEMDYDASFPPFLAEFDDDANPQVREVIRQSQSQVARINDSKQRRLALTALIAADRARGGRPRPTMPAKP